MLLVQRSIRSKEELIVQLGRSFLCAQSGMMERTIDIYAAYIQLWLKQLHQVCQIRIQLRRLLFVKDIVPVFKMAILKPSQYHLLRNMNAPESVERSGLDLFGVGKIAKAIPKEVYTQLTATVCDTFKKLVAPITQTTDGFGRLINQKFDNWTDVQKALGTYVLEQALIHAKARADKKGVTLKPPTHPKTFLRALEESSLETDAILHRMWVNLLASQFADQNSHPRFVAILAELGPEEARLLLTLKPRPDDPRLGSWIGEVNAHFGMTMPWVPVLDQLAQPWNLSVTLICQHSLAHIRPLKATNNEPVLLHLTLFGEAFLVAVSPDAS